jgi:exopolyphosphatase/guanosine-5'-triphosphate,3'-diphosphate pyrophosphatase
MNESAAQAAAIDIGTNSVLLTIAARGASGPEPLLERATITRLGEGVDKTRRLAPAAVERNLQCLSAYAADLRAYGNPRLDVVGTSALRDAEGAQAFLDEAERLLGVRPRVIAGDEEAALTFRGALSGLSLSGELLVFDVGGGSTELILGQAGTPAAAQSAGLVPPGSRVSLDIGSVRLFERHVRSDPPRREELAAIEADIARALAGAPPLAGMANDANVTLVGVAGTVTTLKAVELGLADYDSARVHGAVLTLSATELLCAKLASLSLAERKQLPGLQPKRADVIVAGALIVRDLLRRSGASQLVVSDRGVRFGLLEQLLTA